MSIRKYFVITILALTLSNVYAENTNKGNVIVENMLKKFYDPRSETATNMQFNWKTIFNAIDQYKLNASTLRDNNGDSLLMLTRTRSKQQQLF